MSHNQLHLKDEAATLQIGKRLARATFAEPSETDHDLLADCGVASTGGVIHLHGELGAGKTTLTRGIMRGYGYTGAVKSPTYTLVEPYEFEHCHIYHFDLYRLVDPREIEYLGAEDYFSESNLCIIEWAERGLAAIPPADLKITIEMDGTGRLLNCQSASAKGAMIAKRLWR